MSNMLPKIDLGLIELIKEAHISTLKAEQIGLEEYLRILKNLRDMPPLSFAYSDEHGRRMRLQVPVITLVPMSLLRIEEAEFSCFCSLEIKNQNPENNLNKPPGLAPNINESIALTQYYDTVKDGRVFAKEIRIYQSLSDPNNLTFLIIDREGNRAFYKSDPSQPLRKKRCVLLSLGKPYITLWEYNNSQIRNNEFEWSNRIFIILYGDGSFWYQNHLYRRSSESLREIRIEQPLGGNRRDYAHKHIAWRFLLHSKVDELPFQTGNTKLTMINKLEQSNFSFKIKLKQSPLPIGIADILRTMGSTTRLSEEY